MQHFHDGGPYHTETSPLIYSANQSTGFSLYIFFYLEFLSRTFTIHRTAVEEGGYFFNSSLPLSPACRHLDTGQWLLQGAYLCAQPDSNQEPLVSERKSLTTKLRPLWFLYDKELCHERANRVLNTSLIPALKVSGNSLENINGGSQV